MPLVDRPARERLGLVALSTILASLLSACTNDTRDLAPPDPSEAWLPVISVAHDRASSGEATRSGPAAGARSAALAPDDPAAHVFRVPPDPGLPFPDPHPTIDPAHVYSLVELIDIAERNNKQTRIAWEQARQAAINVGLSRAAYLPALTLSALGGYRRETTPAQTPGDFITSDAEAVFPTLAIQYLLVDFGARDTALRAARNLSEAANASFTAVHQELILSVVRAYLSLATATAELDAARSGLRNTQLLDDAAQARLAHGEGTVTDADETRSGVAQARFQIASAAATAAEARDSLLGVLGAPPQTPISVEPLADRPIPRQMQGNLDGLMREALQSRPDLLASLAKLRASEADVAHARAALYPKISLNVKTTGDIGQIGIEGGPSETFIAPETGIYLDFEWSFYQGGAKQNEIRLAESREGEQQATLQASEDQAMRDVASAYDELDATLSEYDAAVAQRNAASLAFRDQADAFRHGVGTITAAEENATALDRADATLARSHAQVLASAATLAFATGQLTSAEQVPR